MFKNEIILYIFTLFFIVLNKLLYTQHMFKEYIHNWDFIVFFYFIHFDY